MHSVAHKDVNSVSLHFLIMCSDLYFFFNFGLHFLSFSVLLIGMVGWCNGPGLTFSTGAPYNLDDSRARAYCACSRCGWGMFRHFYSPLSFPSSFPSFWETARYRLILFERAVKPKTTNQPKSVL